MRYSDIRRPNTQNSPEHGRAIDRMEFSDLRRNGIAVRIARPAAAVAAKPGIGQRIKTAVRFHHRSVLTTVAASAASFILSLASSQALAHINRAGDDLNTSAATTVTSVMPHTDALAVTSMPDAGTLNPVVITDPNAIYLPEEKIDVPDPLTQRQAFLTAYLNSKHSPLAAHVDALSDQTQWKLIIAIADAESSYCKRDELNNCWGIGGAWDLKSYDNYDQAIADVNRILEQHYISAGMTSPAAIENKWVGHPNQNWQEAANQVMDDLKNAP